jgi:hypothetical protein
MAALRGKLPRLLALLVLIAGLLGAALPGPAAAVPAPAAPPAMQPGMDCDGATHHPAPVRHIPAGDCCPANLCAMGMALLTAPAGLALPHAAAMPPFVPQAMRQPPGFIAAPIPHPPKSRA